MAAEVSQKIIVITGATAGIGYQTALTLCQQGHEVVIVGRNKESGEKAAEELRKKCSEEGLVPSIHFVSADLSSYQSVMGLIEEITNKFPRIDVLINNAGFVVYMSFPDFLSTLYQ